LNNANSGRLDDLFVMRKGDRMAVCAPHTHDLGCECRLFSGDDLIATHVCRSDAEDRDVRWHVAQGAGTERLRKAKAGHVTGGACFGYVNVDVLGVDGKRSHVERKIREAEAVIVRRIFQLCADGVGQTRIAKQLNAEGAMAPRSQQGRPRAWAPSSVHEVLFREVYRGVIVWNQSRKWNQWGQHQQTARPAGEWLQIPLGGQLKTGH
jgi:hypothetical protein